MNEPSCNIDRLLLIIYSFLNQTEKKGIDDTPCYYTPKCYHELKFTVVNDCIPSTQRFSIKIKDTALLKDLK